ncbi:MAG: hypothetical protein WA930_14960 [Rhodanobacter sp.]
MDKLTQRGAARAANLILAAAGYDPKGVSLKAKEKRAAAKRRYKSAEERSREGRLKKVRDDAKRAARKG